MFDIALLDGFTLLVSVTWWLTCISGHLWWVLNIWLLEDGIIVFFLISLLSDPEHTVVQVRTVLISHYTITSRCLKLILHSHLYIYISSSLVLISAKSWWRRKWKEEVLEVLSGSQQISHFCGTQRFITIFTKAYHWTL